MTSYTIERLSMATFSSIGAAIINTAILHATYTQIIPWLASGTAIYLLLIPTFFIGLLNIELSDTVVSMFAAVPLTILLTGFTRASPAFFGFLQDRAVFFVISQFAVTIPLLLPLIPAYVIGTLAGTLFNEFIIEPHTKD